MTLNTTDGDGAKKKSGLLLYIFLLLLFHYFTFKRLFCRWSIALFNYRSL